MKKKKVRTTYPAAANCSKEIYLISSNPLKPNEKLSRVKDESAALIGKATELQPLKSKVYTGDTLIILTIFGLESRKFYI